MMEKINLKQSQGLLLEIAKVVDDICDRHNIPFFMVGGTMLGAVRHKGFIPWDDDMDFGVTYDHYFELIEILKKELPERYRCLYYEDDSPVNSFFFKVEDANTLIDDPCIDLPLEKKIGLSIDIFPIVSCAEENGVVITEKVQNILKKGKMRVVPQNASWHKKFAKKVLIFFMGGNNLREKRKVKKLLDSIPAGDRYCNVSSPQFWRVIWPKATFDELDQYPFENTFFIGPKDYDAYLSRCYKNYMELPPENKRRAHLLSTYLK